MKYLPLTAALFCASFALYAQSHTWLDSTFAQTGIVMGDAPGGNDYHVGTLVRPDGKMLIAGYAFEDQRYPADPWTPYRYVPVVVQRLADGAPDPAFGDQGVVVIPQLGDYVWLIDAALQSDGKLVLFLRAGDNYDYYLIRLDAAGVFDESFGEAGVAEYPGEAWGYGQALCVQPDDRILLGGWGINPDPASTNQDFYLCRLMPDGALDTGFGDDGAVFTDFFGDDEGILSIAAHENGLIAAGGYWGLFPLESNVALYDAQGQLVQTFGDQGRATLEYAYNGVSELIVQDDGSVIVAGPGVNAISGTGFLRRLSPTGVVTAQNILGGYCIGLHTLSNGRLATASILEVAGTDSVDIAFQGFFANGQEDPAYFRIIRIGKVFLGSIPGAGMAVLPDDRLLIGGARYDDYAFTDFYFLKFTAALTPDPDFGENGFVDQNVGATYDTYWSVVIDDQQRIVAAGARRAGFLSRYGDDGTPDPEFDATGGAAIDNLYGNSRYIVASQADGKLIVAYNGFQQIKLARVNADGTADPTFGDSPDGSATIQITDVYADAVAMNMAVQPDQKIVWFGRVENTADGIYEILMARFTPDGRRDSTFSEDGIWRGVPSAGIYELNDGIARSNGEILIAGVYRFSPTNPPTSFLMQFTADGLIDSTFDADGLLWSHHPASYKFRPQSVVEQNDGRLLIAGSVGDAPSQALAISRIEPDGAKDLTFSGDGLAIIQTGYDVATLTDMALQSDGKIVAIGYVADGQGVVEADIVLLRVLPDGALDSTFAGAGRIVTELEGDNRALALVLQPDGRYVAVGYSNRQTIMLRYLPDLDFDLTAEPRANVMAIYPNPIGGSFILKFDLPETGKVNLDLIDVNGRTVCSLWRDKYMPAGENMVEVALPSSVASGAGFLRLSANQREATIRILILR